MDRGIIDLCNYVKHKYVLGGHYLPAQLLRPLGVLSSLAIQRLK